MTAVAPMLEVTDAILEVGGESLLVCMQCGTCTGVCPWGLVKDFGPRHLIRLASLGLEGYEDETLWNCVTCGTCVDRCPREIDIIDIMRSTRAVMLESGSFPPGYRAPLGSLRSEGNPWGSPRTERADWAKGIDIPDFSPSTENLFFACCTHAYDGRNRRSVRDLVTVLHRAAVSMGTLGTRETCCGDQADKCGAADVFATLRDSNSNLFAAEGVRKIITSSPHCMNAFNKQYENGPTALHYTQVLDLLISERRLSFSRQVPLKVAYHDPCYLGRHNGVYEEPRRVLQSIPGLTYIELPRNRERSLCCSGGGGGIWAEVPIDERFSVLRIREAQECGAEVVATACPFCTIMLEDGIKALKLEDQMQVLEVAELVRQAVD